MIHFVLQVIEDSGSIGGDEKMITYFISVGKRFYYPFYLAVVSARKILKQDKVVVYAINPPVDDYYWERLSEIVEIRNRDKIDLPCIDSYMEWRKGAIVADYLRFYLLYKYGGIYMDLDTLTLKDFSYLLEGYEVVLSKYSGDTRSRWSFTGKIRLQNAILLSKPKSELMKIARDNCVSILKTACKGKMKKLEWASSGPGAVSYAYKNCDKKRVNICGREFFFPFAAGQVRVFDEGFDQKYENLHVLHYYTTVSRSKVKKVTPDVIEKSNTVYAKLVKSVLSEEEWRVE